MTTRRNVVLGAGAMAASSVVGTTSLHAQQYPGKPIKIIVANPPGGDDDTLSRYIAQAITGELGQPVIVENRGGASTTIGGAAAAQSPADGYTLLCMHMASIIQTVLRDNLSYSLKSFAPIIGIGGYPMALVVSPKTGLKTMDQVKAAIAKGDGLTYASGGIGTLGHLTAVRFLKAAGGKGTHVAYKNNPEGLQALGGGFTDMMFPSAREAAALGKDGIVTPIAVTSKERQPNLPNTPTMTELGLPQIDARLWYSYVAPAGTPPAIVNRLGELIEKTVKSAAFLERFQPVSFVADPVRGAPLQQFMNTTADRFKELIVENNIKVE